MAQRLTFDVSDSLFFRLKQQAEREGISVDALCSVILEKHDEREPPAPSTQSLFEPMLYTTLPLDILREELQRVAQSPMKNEEKRSRLMKLNFEMAKRYRR